MSERRRPGRDCKSAALLVGGLSVALLASSCSKTETPIKGQLPVFPVSGTLTMDGQPLADATVLFHPVAPFPTDASKILPRAVVNEDGVFQVTTYRADDGAPVGEYKVTVSWRGPTASVGGDDDTRPEKIPVRFRSPLRSTLKAEIKEGANALPSWDVSEGDQQASLAR